MYKRRTDVLLFVNGIPLTLMEFKAPHERVEQAFVGNIRDYRTSIPRVFWFNAFVLVSNGDDTRVGSTYAPWEFFAEWKKVMSEDGRTQSKLFLKGKDTSAK